MFGYDKFRAAIIDTETNGLKPTDSVLAVTTLELEMFINPAEGLVKMFATDLIQQYYNYRPDEPVNPHALAVHQLTPERISELRAAHNQAPDVCPFFEDAQMELHNYLLQRSLIVGHNISFDLRMIHLENPLVPVFCTMKDPRDYYKSVSPEPIKSSVGLARAADLCNVLYNKESKHDATVDTFVTAKVFQHVLDNNKAMVMRLYNMMNNGA